MASRAHPGAGLVRDEGVVHLEEHRGFRVAGQVQHAGQRPAPGVPGHRDQVVVELAGHEHLVRGLLDLGQQLVGALLAAQRGAEVRLAERGLQGPGQVALGQVARPVPVFLPGGTLRTPRRVPCTAPASSRLVAGSSSPEVASSWATELRRSRVTSSAMRAMSTRACSRSIRPARQDTYTPTNSAPAMTRMMSAITGSLRCPGPRPRGSGRA